jgi:hypothetical protein
VAGLVLAVATATAVLHAAGRGPLSPPPLTEPGRLGPWFAERDPVTAALAVLRLPALVAAWYLGLATLVGAGLRLVAAVRPSRVVGVAVRVADRLTVRPLRRFLVATAGVSVALGASPPLALAGERSPPAVLVVAAKFPTGATTTTVVPTDAGSPATPPGTTSTPPAPDPTTGGPPPTITMRLLQPGAREPPSTSVPSVPPSRVPPSTVPPSTVPQPPGDRWTVRPGECFWSIAEDVLAGTWGRAPTDAEIVPYWLRLIERNRAALADRGNADLIYPGQVFAVPPPPSG